FGRAYVCFAEFRSNGHHNPGTAIAPLTVSVSADGGATWRTSQIQAADAGGNGQGGWGSSGCTIRTDSHGVAYLFAEMFENPNLSGLPTHGAHVMFKSFDGGAHWTKAKTLFRTTDPCSFVDPLSSRCVMDGYTGARTDLAAGRPCLRRLRGGDVAMGGGRRRHAQAVPRGVPVGADFRERTWNLGDRVQRANRRPPVLVPGPSVP